jgi:hypothetical protein
LLKRVKARRLLRSCLAEAEVDVEVMEAVGEFPSPSILIDGRDVMGEAWAGAYCRLDVPTRDRFLFAIRSSTHSR